MRFAEARAHGPMLVALTLAACAPTEGPVQLPAGGYHRIEAAPGEAAALVARGATVVADYGAFQVLDAAPDLLDGSPEPGVVYRDEYLRIRLNAREIDSSVPVERPLREPHPGPEGKGLHLVQFRGPVRAEWLAWVVESGVRVVSYTPANAYLVYGDTAALARLHAHALGAREVQHDAPYLPEHKLDPSIDAAGAQRFAVQLVEDPAVNAETLRLVGAVERSPSQVSHALGYVNAIVDADQASLEELARRPDVVSIQPRDEPHLFDERQDMIVAGALSGTAPTGPGYLAWLASHGFTQAQFDASGFGVDVSDSGIDAGTTTPNHFGLYRAGDVSAQSRVAYVRLEGAPNFGSTIAGCDGHGTINAHIVAGYSDATASPFADASGYRYGLGVAPFVRVGGSVIFDPDWFTNPDYEDLQSRAWSDGMRISSNSWGSNTSSYGSDAQRYDALVRDAAPPGSAIAVDGNQEMVIVFAAGNAGPSAGSIGTPGNAKNVISAGAGENVHPFGAPDGCGVNDASADSALDVASFSSRGPAVDGRTRPDLVAPGTHVTGGVAQAQGQRATPPAVGTGQALACYAGDGVCGGASGLFQPAGQQWYTASTGTSHSTPAIAGAAALLRQWFINEGLPPPSPAMTKAYLANSARYMTGAWANDSLQSNAQGMGVLDLGAAFDGTARLLRDQEPEDLFTATGQTRTFTSAIGDPTKPFRVTLAWTDAPGATFSAAYKNDLDLTVEVGGGVYKGNVFSGPVSVTGGSADYKDNMESVFLPAGTTGPFTVTVKAANVNSDGVPGNASSLDQDFALVVWNGCAASPPPVPADVSATATADNEITVSWTPNGAAQYLVYRSIASGSGWVLAATVAAPPFVDAGRSGGTTYFYRLRAQQDCAISGLSAEVSAAATGVCLLAPEFAGLATAATTGSEICGVQLAWSPATSRCGGTIGYDVFRSTEAGFVPGPENRIASGLAATSYVDTYLTGGTTYRYVVRAVETAASAVSDPNSVERAAVPARVQVLFQDDFDGTRPPSPAAWWGERITQGADDLSIVSGCRWQSPNTAYRFGSTGGCGGTYGTSLVNVLVLGGDGSAGPDGLDVPAGGAATLSFRLWYDLEGYYDAARLVYSTTGASGPFAAVGDVPSSSAPYISSGGYDGSVLDGGRGWTGRNSSGLPNGGFKQVTVNLDAAAGQKVWFGWSISADYIYSYEGVFLDDVVLETRDPTACISCAIPPPPAPAAVVAVPGADNQIEVSWTPAGGSAFEVHRSMGAGGPYVLAGTTAASTFVDAGRSGGSTYYYVVRAREGCASSVDSAEASATPTGPCLLAPSFAGLASASSAGTFTCGVALGWAAAGPSCGGAVTYDVFRSTDAGFAPAPGNRIATGVEGTSWVDSGGLASGTAYRYVVRAVEATPGGPTSDANAIERHAAPTWSGGDFADDLDGNRPEAPEAWWIERIIAGVDVLAPVSGCRWQSQTTAYRFGAQGTSCGGSYPNSQKSLLVLGGDGSIDAAVNGFAVPASGSPVLRFALWYALEGWYDSAKLVYSTTGANGTFGDVPDSASTTEPYIVSGGYDGPVIDGGRGWTGTSASALPNGALKQVVVDLSPLAGQTVWLGWKFSSDSSLTYEGVYLDDVELEGVGGDCSTTPLPPGSAIRFRVQLPASVSAGATATATITALDENGGVAVSHAGTATLSTSDGSASIPAEVTFASGVATAQVSFRKAGSQRLVAKDAANAAIHGSGSTQVNAGTAASVRFATHPSNVQAGYSFAPSVTAEVVDTFGNRTASTATVTISVGENPGGGTVKGTTSVAASAGVATFYGIWLEKAGAGYTLVASSAGLAPGSSQAFTVTPSYGSSIAWTAPPSAAVAGEPIAPAPTIQITDSYGNVASWSGWVTISVASGPTGGVLWGTTAAYATQGTATFGDLRLNRVGGYSLHAAASSFGAVSDGFDVAAAAPHHVVFTSEPEDVAAGLALPPLTAVLLDAYENLSAAAATDVHLSLASNPSGGVLLGTTTVTSSGGAVTFSGVSIDRPGKAYAVYAGASGLFGDTSVGFDVLAGPLAKYQIVGPAEVPSGKQASYRLRALDAAGNLVDGYVGNATVTSSDPLAELPAAAALAGGEAFPVRVTFRTEGTQTLFFSDQATSGVGASVDVAVLYASPSFDATGGGGCGSPAGVLSLAGLGALLALRRRRGAPT